MITYAQAFILAVTCMCWGVAFGIFITKSKSFDIDTPTGKNFKHLFGPAYLVRTQAGFAAARKDFLGGLEADQFVGFPKSYPSIVVFDYEYYGGYRLNTNAIHLNQLLRDLGIDFRKHN